MPDEERTPAIGGLGDRLLAQQSAGGSKLELYRKEVTTMLELNEKRLKREKWATGAIWFMYVILSTGFMVAGGMKSSTPLGTFFAVTAVFWIVIGAMEVLKHFMNRTRVDLLKEIKQLELRVMELADAIKR